MFKIFKKAKKIKSTIDVLRLVSKDARTPKASKVLLWAALGYMVLPFDIIPDFIPVIGHLDDAIIIPILVGLALLMIPKEVMEDCKRKAEK